MSKVTRMTVSLPDGSTQVLVPAGIRRFYVQPDQFTAKWNYAVRPAAPCPAVFRTGVISDTLSFQRAKFTKQWQFFAADLLSLQAFGMRYAALSSLPRSYIAKKFSDLYNHYKAFTNFKGVDNCNNYITGNMTGEEPRVDPLICASDAITGTVVVRSDGMELIRLQSFIATEPPPVPDLSDPRVMWATVIKADGTLNNFPQLGGLPVPYPLISVEPYYYELRETKEVK